MSCDLKVEPGSIECGAEIRQVSKPDKTKDPNYQPYVSKSDRPKGMAKELKRIGLMGNMAAMVEANEMLSPSFAGMRSKPFNQRQKRNAPAKQTDNLWLF